MPDQRLKTISSQTPRVLCHGSELPIIQRAFGDEPSPLHPYAA
nr:hypothetical protein [uncultured Kingella sp.]